MKCQAATQRRLSEERDKTIKRITRYCARHGIDIREYKAKTLKEAVAMSAAFKREEDFEPHETTVFDDKAYAGTKEKMALLRKRIVRGEELFHESDPGTHPDHEPIRLIELCSVGTCASESGGIRAFHRRKSGIGIK